MQTYFCFKVDPGGPELFLQLWSEPTAVLTIGGLLISHSYRQVGWTWRQREEETGGRGRP